MIVSDILPWYPRFYRRWELSPTVRRLGPVARCYLESLLALQFQEGFIPSDLATLRAILTMPADPGGAFDPDAVIKQVLESFMPDGNGGLTNPEMSQIRTAAIEAYEKKVRAGRARHRGNQTSPQLLNGGAERERSLGSVEGMQEQCFSTAEAAQKQRSPQTDRQGYKQKNKKTVCLQAGKHENYSEEDLALVICALDDKKIDRSIAKKLLGIARGDAVGVCHAIDKLTIGPKIHNPEGLAIDCIKNHFEDGLANASKLAVGARAMEAEHRKKEANSQ